MRITPRLAAVAAALLLLLYAAGVVFAIWQARLAVESANRQWCSTIKLLTSRPVPKPGAPEANPSRENAYILYQDFIVLRDRFGCVP